MYCMDVFLPAGRRWLELSETCEEVKLASGSGAQGANKVKYYHNALLGPEHGAVIERKNTGSSKQLNLSVCPSSVVK